MDAYTSFAQVYDTFMDNIPYETWAMQTAEILKEHGIMDGIVADLGCGTGKLTQALAHLGFDMIGIDNSMDMLDFAMQKRVESGADILYLLQDMREFELYGTCRAIISRCDSLNYITSYEELCHVFSLVDTYLDPQGLFIFDMNTIYKYERVLADYTFAENRKEASFIWENFYDADTYINEYALTLFVKSTCTLYEKSEEHHVQRAYTIEEVKMALERVGLIFLDVRDADTNGELTDTSQRMLCIARECKKSWKD